MSRVLDLMSGESCFGPYEYIMSCSSSLLSTIFIYFFFFDDIKCLVFVHQPRDQDSTISAISLLNASQAALGHYLGQYRLYEPVLASYQGGYLTARTLLRFVIHVLSNGERSLSQVYCESTIKKSRIGRQNGFELLPE